MAAVPSLSVIIAAYNRGPRIGLTLDSVVRQTAPANEIVVVDDASTEALLFKISPRAIATWLLRRGHIVPVAAGSGDQAARAWLLADLQSPDTFVTFKGSPIEEGIISFEPLDKGPTMDGSIILKGKYTIPRDKGLAAGKYQVRIYAGDGQSGEGKAGITRTADPKPKRGFKGLGIERVPPEYNTKSTLVREVTADGSNQFDFDIP